MKSLQLLPVLALLSAGGCTTIDSTQTAPDGTTTRFSFASGSSKTVFKNLKSPGVNIGSFGTDISAQLQPILDTLGGIAQSMAAQQSIQLQQMKLQQPANNVTIRQPDGTTISVPQPQQ